MVKKSSGLTCKSLGIEEIILTDHLDKIPRGRMQACIPVAGHTTTTFRTDEKPLMFRAPTGKCFGNIQRAI
jgi:hypothetical protein